MEERCSAMAALGRNSGQHCIVSSLLLILSCCCSSFRAAAAGREYVSAGWSAKGQRQQQVLVNNVGGGRRLELQMNGQTSNNNNQTQVNECQCPGKSGVLCSLGDITSITSQSTSDPSIVIMQVVNNCDFCTATTIYLDCSAIDAGPVAICVVDQYKPLAPHEQWLDFYKDKPLATLPPFQVSWECTHEKF